MDFPDIALVNRFYLGDSVLLEPIACALSEALGSGCYIVSRYSELFLNHPEIVGLQPEGPFPPDMRAIDLSEALASTRAVKGNGRQNSRLLGGKYARLWRASGLSPSVGRAPRLHLSNVERDRAAELRHLFGEKCVGIVLHSNMPIKVWPYMKHLMKSCRGAGYNVFAISDNLGKKDSYVLDLGAYRVIGKPLRELMIYLSFLDLVVGGDTGPVHIAAALGTETLVITRKLWQDLWPYENCTLLTTDKMGKRGLRAIKPKTVFSSVRGLLGDASHAPMKSKASREQTIALFRLDGLGGSITLADHAKKIYEMTGRRCTAIVRGYGTAFRDNPYIRDVVEVGHVKWGECVEEMKLQYDTLAEIRFAPAKWHQSNGKLFDQDFSKSQGLFDAFPKNYRDLEIHGLHHVQLTDRYLGLPYNSIDMEIFYYENPALDLPDEYVLVTNGVDSQHGAMRQTKVWDGWNEFAKICPIPIVQVGSLADPGIVGAFDYRGKTSISQFFSLLRDASAVVCNEGGTMHSAYAVGAKNVVVLRGPTRGKLFEYPGHRFVDSYMCEICWSSTDDWYARCPKGLDSVCMKSITAERVAYNLQEVLDGG